jgi:hypothetical protein
MSADITVFAFIWGDTHNHFVADWAAAIEALDPAPADVVIATHPDRPANIRHLPYRILELPDCGQDVRFLNQIVKTIDTKWVAECDIDDRLYPDAFTHLEAADGFDVCANSIRLNTDGTVHRSRPEGFRTSPSQNWVTVNSYYTRAAFDKVGGYPADVPWHDWALWWKFHVHGMRWFHTPGVQMLYNDVPSPIRGSLINTAANDEKVRAWIRSYRPAVG